MVLSPHPGLQVANDFPTFQRADSATGKQKANKRLDSGRKRTYTEGEQKANSQMRNLIASTNSSPLIRCGPAGWAHKHWEGAVFPPGLGPDFSALEFTAGRFDTLEVTSSFYHMVRPELARYWARTVNGNPRFQFTARMNRQFTHERQVDEASVKQFSEGLRPLLDQGRLGCVLMQFPSSFRFTTENRAFLIQLRRQFSQFPLVAELRHPSWNLEEATGTLIDYHIGFANIDQPQSVRAMPPTSRLTWRVGYVKLHGRRCGPGFDLFDDRPYRVTGNDYFYTEAELSEWRTRIENVAKFAESAFVVFNNDAGGKSVVNALQMQSLLASCEAPGVPAKGAAAAANAPLFATRAA
jgi:uncharacterized protein YecE (DUF72 family)